MQMLSIRKPCEVEVSSEEEGLQGSSYRAILEENPSGCKQLRVRYLTLLEENGLSPLTKWIDQSLIRPVPPENLHNDIVLEEGLVVDAYLRDGWWIGVLIKKLEDDENENENFLVYFDSLQDIMEFERNQLRAHLDWTGSKWIQPEIKELDKSVFSSGALVELRDDLGWILVIVIKELENEKKFVVKYSNRSFDYSGKSRIVVDSLRVRPMQPSSFSVNGDYGLLDLVEVFCGCVWREGVVRGILYEGRYMVSFGETKEASQFNHSDLRSIMEWKDGVWYRKPKGKSVNGTPLDMIVTPVKQDKAKGKTSNEKPLGLMMIQNRFGHESIREKMYGEHNSAKRKTKADDMRMVLPFAKKSPLWNACEVFKRVPSPHFSPLLETEEEFREGSALGMMVTFSGLLEKFKYLDAGVTISQLGRLKDCFVELEKHGFDVTTPLSRINKLLDLKGVQAFMVKN